MWNEICRILHLGEDKEDKKNPCYNFEDILIHMWRWYALEDDKNLTNGAIEIKRKLWAIVNSGDPNRENTVVFKQDCPYITHEEVKDWEFFVYDCRDCYNYENCKE